MNINQTNNPIIMMLGSSEIVMVNGNIKGVKMR